MSRWASAIRKGLFLAIATTSVGIGIYGTKQIEHAEATKGWPTTQGKIVASELRPEDKSRGPRPLIRVEYELRGTIFHSEQYRQDVAGDAMEKSQAEALLKKYPVGAKVTVHYDPMNPGNSVLEENDPTFGYLVCAGAVILFGAGAILTLKNRKQERQMTNVPLRAPKKQRRK